MAQHRLLGRGWLPREFPASFGIGVWVDLL
jgi:hypothetical protein